MERKFRIIAQVTPVLLITRADVFSMVADISKYRRQAHYAAMADALPGLSGGRSANG
jgi:hypothetical protein